MKNKILSVAALTVTSTLLAIGATSAAVPHSFTSGTAALAAEVNSNFDNLDQRITSLESTSTTTVAVDCATNSTALKDLTLTPNTTYVLTGICDGQIVVGAGLGTINIQGDDVGSMDDGITLQPGETDADSVFAAIYGTSAVRLNLSNLVITADSYNGTGDLYISAVGSFRAAHVVLDNVNVVGGDAGITAANTGSISTNENVSITGFRENGLSAANAAVVRVFDSITITGGTGQEGSFSDAVGAYNGGVVRIIGSATAITSGSGPTIDAAAISAIRNGTITVDGGTLNGTVWSGESSAVDLRNLTQLGGNLEPFRNGVLRIRNSNVVGASGDEISVGGFSNLRLDSTVVNNVSGTASLDTYRYGVIDIRGTSDLNGRDINCADPRELRVDGTVLNVGAVSC